MSRADLLEDVDVFVEVVSAQSFSRAAGRMGLPASTVSARIRRLEDRLATTLLHRTTRRLSLTDAGERYFAHCVQAIDLVQQGERTVATMLDEPRGRLRITAPADLAQSVLIPIIAAYQQRFPDVAIELLVSNAYRDLVGDGIDLAVRIGELRSSSLIVRRFFDSALGLWASPDYLAGKPPLTSLADLSGHNLVQMGSVRRDMILHHGSENLLLDTVPGHLQIDDMRTCQAYAEHGLGIALLPLFCQFDAGHNARLVRILPAAQTATFPVQFLYPRQNHMPPVVRTFIELAVAIWAEIR